MIDVNKNSGIRLREEKKSGTCSCYVARNLNPLFAFSLANEEDTAGNNDALHASVASRTDGRTDGLTLHGPISCECVIRLFFISSSFAATFTSIQRCLIGRSHGHCGQTKVSPSVFGAKEQLVIGDNCKKQLVIGDNCAF